MDACLAPYSALATPWSQASASLGSGWWRRQSISTCSAAGCRMAWISGCWPSAMTRWLPLSTRQGAGVGVHGGGESADGGAEGRKAEVMRLTVFLLGSSSNPEGGRPGQATSVRYRTLQRRAKRGPRLLALADAFRAASPGTTEHRCSAPFGPGFACLCTPAHRLPVLVCLSLSKGTIRHPGATDCCLNARKPEPFNFFHLFNHKES